jgi:CO dehydrogenase/acetyl-CoA synthase epsilon subunit
MLEGVRIIMVIGDMVSGTDLFNREVVGKVEKVLNKFPIAIVRTGRDNTQVTQCDINNISVVNEQVYR